MSWRTVSLELLVAVHGTLVAVMNSGPDGMWPMFLFGFVTVFVVTQMHGLGLSTRTRWWLFGVRGGRAGGGGADLARGKASRPPARPG